MEVYNEPRDEYCSYVVTKDSPVFQSIYICHDCCSTEKKGELLCICDACANQCHAEHDGLEYIGMGPSYCDCNQLNGGCCIKEISDAYAEKIGAVPLPLPSVQTAINTKEETPSVNNNDYTTDIYHIQNIPTEKLSTEAEILVKHSKDTFWLDVDEALQPPNLCILEQVALNIMQQHIETYQLENICGCEWWVQVKDVVPASASTTSNDGLLDAVGDSAHAVDLHYDKDEVLAESFQIGRFPTLSTVTYVQGDANAPPTIVLFRRYDEPEDQVIDRMFVSRPSVGKHLVFDGRLLHGAPAHYALRGKDPALQTATRRVTFLVNVWTHQKPIGVHVLDDSIRESLVQRRCELIDEFVWEPQTTTDVALSDDVVLPESHRGRIEIPFTGASTTWGDEGDAGTVIVTFPPDPSQDNVNICFTNGLQAYQDVIDDDKPRLVEAQLSEVYV